MASNSKKVESTPPPYDDNVELLDAAPPSYTASANAGSETNAEMLITVVTKSPSWKVVAVLMSIFVVCAVVAASLPVLTIDSDGVAANARLGIFYACGGPDHHHHDGSNSYDNDNYDNYGSDDDDDDDERRDNNNNEGDHGQDSPSCGFYTRDMEHFVESYGCDNFHTLRIVAAVFMGLTLGSGALAVAMVIACACGRETVLVHIVLSVASIVGGLSCAVPWFVWQIGIKSNINTHWLHGHSLATGAPIFLMAPCTGFLLVFGLYNAFVQWRLSRAAHQRQRQPKMHLGPINQGGTIA